MTRAVISAALVLAVSAPAAQASPPSTACHTSRVVDRTIAMFEGWDNADPTGIAISTDPTTVVAPFGIVPPRPGNRWSQDQIGVHQDRDKVLAWLNRRVPQGDRVRLFEIQLIHPPASATDAWGFLIVYRRLAPDISGSRPFYGVAKWAMDCSGALALGGGRSYWHRGADQRLCSRRTRPVHGVRICGFTYNPPTPAR